MTTYSPPSQLNAIHNTYRNLRLLWERQPAPLTSTVNFLKELEKAEHSKSWETVVRKMPDRRIEQSGYGSHAEPLINEEHLTVTSHNLNSSTIFLRNLQTVLKTLFKNIFKIISRIILKLLILCKVPLLHLEWAQASRILCNVEGTVSKTVSQD